MLVKLWRERGRTGKNGGEWEIEMVQGNKMIYMEDIEEIVIKPWN